MTPTRAGVAIVVMLVAVVLGFAVSSGALSPGDGRGTSSPGSRTPGVGLETDSLATPGASATPLPRFATFGEPLPAGRVSVTGASLRTIDLTTGALSEPLRQSTRPSTLIPTADGFVCVCVRLSENADGTVARVRLEILDGAGRREKVVDVGTFRGLRDPFIVPAEQLPAVGVTGTASSDARHVYLGVATRGARFWSREVRVVDLVRGLTLQRVPLRRYPVAQEEGGSRQDSTAPAILLAPGESHLAISVREIVAGAATTRHWRAAVRRGRLNGIRPLSDPEGWLQTPACTEAGFASKTVYYAICASHSPSPLVALADITNGGGRAVRLNAFGGSFSGVLGDAADIQAGHVFVWNPEARKIARVSAVDGQIELRTLDSEAPPRSPTRSEGVLVQPPVAVAGGRVYLAGSRPAGDEPAGGGATSGGGAAATLGTTIVVLDANTLDVIAEWPATARFGSLAASGDGQFLYALGEPGMDDAGHPTGQPASLTVYDTATGAIRLIAGDLGLEPFRHLRIPVPKGTR